MTGRAYLAGLVQRWMTDSQVPGLAAGIYRDGDEQVAPFGITALDTGFAVRPDTVFQVGSISKSFTAVLLMTLVEKGRLDLDQPVQHYVPGFALRDRQAAAKITTRHLLTHTAGFSCDWLDDFGLGDDAIERFVARFDEFDQITAPGERWAYNNCGYILAGLLAARICGSTFDAVMRERVIEPLGLSRTFLSPAAAIAYPVAVGHIYDSERDQMRVARSCIRPPVRNPSGGVMSTIEDIMAFARFLLRGHPRVLSPETLAGMREMATDTGQTGRGWGIGFSIERRGDVQLVGHSGSTHGFRSLLTLVPDSQFALAILTNSDRGSRAAREITDGVLKRELGIDSSG